MQKKPDIAAVADNAEPLLAAGMLPEVEFGRILDRQHMTPARRLGRMMNRRGEHGFQANRIVVQKPSEGYCPSPIAA